MLKTGNDGSQTKRWFDKLGREIRSDIKGFGGFWIYTDTRYNLKGQVDSISEPYYSGPLWNRYQYDNYGRKTFLYRPSGRNSSWTYNNNTITETTDGKSFSKTYSSDGTVSAASDPGGTINYTYFPDGKVKNITAPGGLLTQMQYDIRGNQTQLVDPSAGTINYTFNGFGQLLSQQSARQKTTTITYNSNGTINTKVTPEGTTKYRYNANKQLTNVSSPGGVSRSFAYDSKGRVTMITDTIPGTAPLITSFTYDTYGRLGTITHPSGIVETKNYNSNGYLSSVSTGGSTRWTISSMNARQQITGDTYGSNLTETLDYNSYGYLTSVSTGTNGSIRNYQYDFNSATGNLNWRKNLKQSNIMENFEYNLDRLIRVYRGSTTLLNMAYESNKGGITTKSDVGTLQYNNSGKPYALSSIIQSTGVVPTTIDSLTYTSFESVKTISEGNNSATFTYNPFNERAKMEIKQSGSTILTRWYSNGNYIKETAGGVTKEYTFIGGDAYTAPIATITQGGTTTYYNQLRDHLGSITHVVNASDNTLLYEYSYDPWGRMRNVTTWTNYAPGSEPSLFIAGRGFTGHEHLPWFNLINMNGRVYDPLAGQFLSPDNHVQDPYFSQSLNRYSYCLNNPLKYTDPSGFTLDDLMHQSYYGSYDSWIALVPVIQSGGYRSSTGTFNGKDGVTFIRRLDGSTKFIWSEFSHATSTTYGNRNGILEILAEKGEPITVGHQFTLNLFGRLDFGGVGGEVAQSGGDFSTPTSHTYKTIQNSTSTDFGLARLTFESSHQTTISSSKTGVTINTLVTDKFFTRNQIRYSSPSLTVNDYTNGFDMRISLSRYSISFGLEYGFNSMGYGLTNSIGFGINNDGIISSQTMKGESGLKTLLIPISVISGAYLPGLFPILRPAY